MNFAHDTDVALSGAAALINTLGPPDTLTSPADLAAFVADYRWSGAITGDERELRAVRALRPGLRAVWTSDVPGMVEGVNAMLAAGRALPRLARHDEFDWHIHATDDDAPLATRMAVEAAMALVDVIRLGETSRLGTCADPECDNVIIDLSRNRSRRYCEAGCGNRANVAAYRARQRG